MSRRTSDILEDAGTAERIALSIQEREQES